MKEVMIRLHEAVANMESILGETIDIPLNGLINAEEEYKDIPFVKNMTAKCGDNVVRIEFYSADELTDDIYHLAVMMREEEYLHLKKIPEGTVIDEDQTVRWNREEVARRNEEMDKRLKNERHWRSLEDRAMRTIIKASANTICMTEFNDKALDILFAKAWEDGHSYGYTEVSTHFKELVEIFEDACKAQGYII